MTNKVRRITERAVAQGEEAAIALLIGGEMRVGTLDGVHVDFRHPMLPADWEALPWWYVWGAPPNNAGIIFPSEAKFGLKKLRKEKMQPDLQGIVVLPGDRITIDDVKIEIGDRRFDHHHDREVRLARLRIERPTGETFHAGPLAFYGVGRILQHGTREAFDHILDRILRHAEAEVLPQWTFDVQPFWTREMEAIALDLASEAHREYFEIADALPADEAGGLVRARLRGLANNAALAGFLLAKIEGKEPARRAEREIENAQLTAAGRKNSELRQQARNLAAKNPSWKRNRIAKELLILFPSKEMSAINRILRTESIGPEPTKAKA